MCERSNRPTRSRTARCSSMIEVYWTGIRQPENSIIRACSAVWRFASGVSRTAWPLTAASVTRRLPPRWRWRGIPTIGRSAEQVRRTGDERALGLEGQDRGGLPEIDPAHLVELVVMPVEVAAHGFHHEVVDRLVDPRTGLDEPVFDVLERPGDPDIQAGLLADLAQGRLLGGLAALGRALGKGPGPTVAFAAATADHELGSPGLIPDDDAAGRRGGRGPQACHGAVAARGRRPGPDRAARAQCISTSGRSRPFWMRGRAGRGPRQPARRRA